MPRKSGPKSQAELSVPESPQVQPLAPAPKDLGTEAARLWRSIVASRPHDFFGAGDLPLLREYCYNTTVLLPRLTNMCESGFDAKTLDARDKVLKTTLAIARSLRICVSARTRPDTASMRDSVKGAPNLWS